MNEMIKKTTDIIEENIDSDLNLEAISNRIGYSKFHFHRMFLNDMGISVIDYVRRRRIIRSTYQLINTNTSVTDIGLEIGFSNIDTYIRAFKNHFGITPNQYRNYKQVSREIYMEACSVMNDLIKELKNCTDNDKQEAIKAVDKVIALSRTAHKNGLLSLQGEVENDGDQFLTKGIELLLEGVEHTKLKETLYTYVATSKLSNQKLLESIIYIEGILMIQSGAYPWVIKEHLKAYFGVNFIERIDTHYESDFDIHVSLNRYRNDDNVTANSKSFSNELKRIDLRSMQRLLRECDLVLVAFAFYGADHALREVAIESLPKHKLMNMLEIIDLKEDINIAQVIDAQNEILRIYKELRLAGDVV